MLNIASKNKSNGRGFPLIFPTATKRKKKKFESKTLRISLPFLISYYYFNFFTFSNPLTMNTEYSLHFITVSSYIAMYHYVQLCTTVYHYVSSLCRPHEDGGGDCSDLSASQRMPKLLKATSSLDTSPFIGSACL